MSGLRESDTELAFAGVARLGRLLRQREVTSYELTELFLHRLGGLGPAYNAVASLTAERAHEEANRADARLRRGGAGARNALLGIPYGAKDLVAARGAPTTWGAPPFAHQVFEDDAKVVSQLRRAGAVLTAKLAMVELAGGGGYRYPSASLQGPGRNPWDLMRWAGGSSSGSGAAVAAGLVPWAIGSETSGSILTPAAFCGVTGLRPTYGLVPRRGAMVLSGTLDKLGPMARSAEDCALALEVMAGLDRDEPASAGKRFRFTPPTVDNFAGIRLGYAPADFEELAAPSARDALGEGLRALVKLGLPLYECSLPPDLPYSATVSTVISAEGSTAFASLIEGDRFEELIDAKQKAGLRAGLLLTAREYLDAMRIRSQVCEAFRALFRDVDVLVSGARGAPASGIDEALGTRRGQSSGGDGDSPQRPNNASLIAASNLAGLPALSIPCGFSAEGLPLGLQLVGPTFSENRLLALGVWFQSQTDWHLRRPPEPRTSTRT